MSWNYRVGKRTVEDEEVFGIHTTYYNPDGSIWATSETSTFPLGLNMKELKSDLKKMNDALKKPIIDLDNIIYAKREV